MARWFDTSAFATAPQFTLGSSSRNPVRGPSYRNCGSGAHPSRAARSGRKAGAAGRAVQCDEHAPLGPPNGVFGSAAFGTITSAGDPRVVQLAVKVYF